MLPRKFSRLEQSLECQVTRSYIEWLFQKAPAASYHFLVLIGVSMSPSDRLSRKIPGVLTAAGLHLPGAPGELHATMRKCQGSQSFCSDLCCSSRVQVSAGIRPAPRAGDLRRNDRKQIRLHDRCDDTHCGIRGRKAQARSVSGKADLRRRV